MSDGHCFISYSNGDADDFGPQLAYELEGGHPYIDAWFDKRDIKPGQTWDESVPKAISSCKCLLFVMTKDSVAENSICFDEWDLALKYKKPILVLRLHTAAEPPFRLGKRQWIDFSEIYKAGMAKLRLTIQHLESPEGQLEILKDRLSDAQRDLIRAKDEDKPRIQAEIEELNSKIQFQQKIVDDPKGAEDQTKKNIEAGLERERQPEKPVLEKTSTRFINPPPGIAPNYFQDRLIETKQIVDFLNNDSQRLMTIVGRAGVGKTAMVCRLLKALERGELPDDLGEMKADGIVYLSETGSHRVNFANIFADLSKLLPKEIANGLEEIYKNPHASTGDKMRALLDAFPSGRVILLLDNFETLVDSESLSLRNSELSDALSALLGGQHHAVKAVITTRIAPRDLAVCEPGRQHNLSLDEGLGSPYAENVLRKMDADGHVGLKTAPDALLKVAREKTRGYPRALEALYAILSVDRYTRLEELLEISLPEEVVQKLVGEAFNRLDPSAQKVMQALAVYNRPVSPAAIDYLLQPHLPSIDSVPILQRLANMHFARKESGKFYLHHIDREYAFGLIPEEPTAKIKSHYKKENEKVLNSSFVPLSGFSKIKLLRHAANYFRHARMPVANWKKLDNLAAQLAEFDLWYAAGDFDLAADLLTDIDFDYLLLWGHYRLVVELHSQLRDKIRDKYLRMSNLNGLGFSNHSMGKLKEAINFYQQGLEIAHDADRQAEGALLGNLGSVYANLGNVHKAIEYYEKALAIAQEISDHRNEGVWLGSLGSRYSDLGNTSKALEFYNLALVIRRKIGDRKGEAIDIENIGYTFLSLGDYEKTKVHIIEAIQIADEISFQPMQQYGRWRLAQAYLLQSYLGIARSTIEAGLRYDAPEYNHNATALYGIIALRQGERETAQEAFTKSIAQADEILAKTHDYYEALDAKGLALSGLLVIGNSGLVNEAVETFRKARKIAPHAGIVKSVLRLFDELAQCDPDGLLKDVRPAAVEA